MHGSSRDVAFKAIAQADINYDDSVDASDASSVLSYYAFTSSGGELSIKEFMNK